MGPVMIIGGFVAVAIGIGMMLAGRHFAAASLKFLRQRLDAAGFTDCRVKEGDQNGVALVLCPSPDVAVEACLELMGCAKVASAQVVTEHPRAVEVTLA